MNEEELSDIFNKEILRELMMETDPEVTDEEVDKYFDMSNKNPWDGKLLYEIQKCAKELYPISSVFPGE